MTTPLTPKQLETAKYVRDYVDKHGYGPTLQEAADAFSISKVSMFERIQTLIRKGVLSQIGGVGATRGLRYDHESGALPVRDERTTEQIAEEIGRRLDLADITMSNVQRIAAARIVADVLEGR